MKRKTHLILIAVLISQAFLATCTPKAPTPPAPTETTAPTQPPAPTLTPTLEIPPTPTPHPLTISPKNADQIVQLGQWGKGYPTQIVWSPDGTMIAVATSIGTYLLDGDTFKELMFLESETEVTSIDFNLDGSLLALSGCRHYDLNLVCNIAWVTVVNTETGNELQTFDPGFRNHPSIKFSPNGKYLIAAGCNKESGPGVHCHEGKVAVWDVTTGETVHDWAGHGGWVNTIAFNTQGNLIASLSGGNLLVNHPSSIIVRDLNTGSKVLDITIEGTAFSNFVSFDQSGKVLMTGNREGQLSIFDAQSGELLDSIETTDEDEVAQLFSQNFPAYPILIKEDLDTVQIWNEDGKLQNRLSIPENQLAWSIHPDLTQVAAATATGLIVNDVEGTIYQEDWKNVRIEASGTLPNGQWVLAGSHRDDQTWLFDPLTGDPVHIFPVKPDQDIAISANGEMIAISNYSIECYPNAGFSLFQIASGEELFNDSSPVYALAFSPDSQYLATSGAEGEITLWNISDPENTSSISFTGAQGSYTDIEDLAFTPDGNYLLAGNRDIFLQIWTVPSGNLLSTINDCYSKFFMLSPDGNTLVYTDNHNIHRLVFVDISPIIGMPAQVIEAPYIVDGNSFKSGFAFHPKGQIFAFGDSDSYVDSAEIFLWDIVTPWSLISLEGHKDWLHFLAFSPDGRYLVSNGYDGTTRIWGLPEP